MTEFILKKTEDDRVSLHLERESNGVINLKASRPGYGSNYILGVTPDGVIDLYGCISADFGFQLTLRGQVVTRSEVE